MAKARKTDAELLKQLDEFETNQKTLQRGSTVPGIGETISNWITPAMTEGQKAQRLFKANELEYGSGASEAPLAQPYPGTYGPRSTPGKMGTALGQMMGDFLAGLKPGTPLANTAAALMNDATPGVASLVEAASKGVDPAWTAQIAALDAANAAKLKADTIAGGYQVPGDYSPAGPDQLSGLERGGRTPGYFNVQAAPGSPMLRFPGHLGSVGGMAARQMRDDYTQSQRRAAAGTIAAGLDAAGSIGLTSAGAVTRTPEQRATWEAEQERGPSTEQKRLWGQDLRPDAAMTQKWNAEKQALVNGPGTDADLRTGLEKLQFKQNQEWSQYVHTIRQTRQAEQAQLVDDALAYAGKAVPKELKGLPLDLTRGNSADQIGRHLAATGQLTNLSPEEAARKIEDVSTRHAAFTKAQQVSAGVGGVKTLTDAYNYFVALGEEPGNAVKYAGQWAKAMSAESEGKIGEAMTPTQRDLRAQDPAGESKRRQTEQIQTAIKAGLANRAAPTGVTAAPAPAERQQALNKTKTKQEIALNDLKLRTEELAPLMAQANLDEKVGFPALAWSLTPGANGKTPSGVTKTQFDLLEPLEKQNHMRIAAGLYVKHVLGNKEK